MFYSDRAVRSYALWNHRAASNSSASAAARFAVFSIVDLLDAHWVHGYGQSAERKEH
jgi:hypothetical protein